MADATDWFGGQVSAEQAERLAALYDLDVPQDLRLPTTDQPRAGNTSAEVAAGARS